jgi:hypothetical protein
LDKWIMMTVKEYCWIEVDENGDHFIISTI